MAIYNEGKILEALKGMDPTKASRADGFPAMFYQQYWHIIGKDTCDFCLDILNNRNSLDEIKMTYLVLIPKTANPTNLKNYRPISLCTVIYKIIAKTVANRLQNILNGCIDEAQNAFVPGRIISDNVLLAYDRVEWYFIRGIMANMGLEDGFTNFILHCLNSVKYSILINGEVGSNFRSSRGLRQGDLLSPYLFLFCGEGLSTLMRLASQEMRILGAKVCTSAPPITHLMFADDCILFGEVSNRGISLLKEILEVCEACSGQCVNFEKSTAFFNSNVGVQDKNLVFQILKVRCSTNPEKYLGLPNLVGRNKKLAFQNLKDRLKQKINSWSLRHISQGGREVFIKSILQAIPSYTMACFLLPKALCSELENIMGSFLWRKKYGKRGMH
ncbi:hypothetical protein J1N35_017391 [Gossypium stocksii]|uniref:Reverse transcriptase domain-containing protein n=1 Tax=Gossypium stocksii TaxID=47602 RepID=A0A9D3VMA5_9ROSI|nr:hypothetical protein J1N35_017391 [Gossypium stocksii]